MSQLLPLASHPRAGPREGLLWLLAFLPSTMGEDFAGLIHAALPVVLKVGFCAFLLFNVLGVPGWFFVLFPL